MSKEYRKRLFALMDEIDELAKMGISLEREEISGEVEVPQRSEKVQPKIEVKKNKIEEIPEEPTGPNHDTTRLQIGHGGIDDIMLWVSQYGAAAEETGFYAGFKMAWELLKNMQEGAE
ncbi:MAG: hypothetical protein ACLUPZ_03335 [Lachnospiraceae bacterium]